MGLDEELAEFETGTETITEQIDQETEVEDAEEFQDDEEFDPRSDEADLEDAYESFFAEEGPDGEGEVSPDGDDGGLAAVVERVEGLDLSEEGFHIVGEDDLGTLTEEGVVLGDDLADDTEEGVIAEPSVEDDGYELVELELDEDDIVRYLEDEEGNLVGFVLLEDGEEAEYFYVEEEAANSEEENEFDLGITKEGVSQAASEMNAIYRDGAAVAGELKAAFDDIKQAFDFSAFKK